uniref:Uncharacterized protein n=1 Tax=Meloidogyne enterolobii TaxID=390850 RepID=A0A6V7UL23_MELEN|nr:unnamed protein product [Meloidogyne enterolobii]
MCIQINQIKKCIVDNKIIISFLVFILILFIGGFSLLKIVQLNNEYDHYLLAKMRNNSLNKEAIESISDAAVLKARIAIIDGTLVIVTLIVILFAVLLFFLHKWFKNVNSKVTQTTNPIVINQHSQNNPQQNIDRNEGVGDIQEVVVQGSQTQGSQDSNKNEQDFPSSSRIGTNEDQIKMLEVVQFEKSIQLVKIQIDAQAD